MKFQDGTGAGHWAEVDSKNKLHTLSTTRAENELATIEGDSYNVNTGIITLTNATETTVAYIKNNESRGLHIEAIAMGIGPAGGSPTTSEIERATVIKNPTTGDIITNANVMPIHENRNFGQTKTLSINEYVGATGETLVNGSEYLLVYTKDDGRSFITIDTYLPQGKSIAINFKATTGTTSIAVYMAFIGHLESTS